MDAASSTAFIGYLLPNDTLLRRDLYHLETQASLPDGTFVTLPAPFAGSLSLVGYERLQQSHSPGGYLMLLTYWRVDKPPLAPLKVFVHLLGQSDLPVAQHDGLGSPPRGWAPGDIIIQKHILSLPPHLADGQYRLQVWLYDPDTGDRLPVLTADRLLLYSLEVRE